MNVGKAADMVREHTKREVAICSLTGSRNQNLHTEGSDHDIMAFTVPSMEDMYERNEYYGEIKGDGYEIRIHDLRKLPDLLWKSNPTYLEVLFSRERIMCDAMRALLYENRERIARMNLPYLYNSSAGQYHYRMKYLEKGTGPTQRLVERFGYDTKQAAHAYRMLRLLQWYAEDGRFEEAMIFDGGSARREEILSIKQGKMTLPEMREMLEKEFKETEERCRERYLTAEADRETERTIRTGVKEFILERIESEIRNKGIKQ